MKYICSGYKIKGMWVRYQGCIQVQLWSKTLSSKEEPYSLSGFGVWIVMVIKNAWKKKKRMHEKKKKECMKTDGKKIGITPKPVCLLKC